MRTFILGRPQLREPRETMLRRGTIRFHSPHGLAAASAQLVEALPKAAPGRALFGMDTEGATAMVARALWPDCDAVWFHFDAYLAAKVRRGFDRNALPEMRTFAVEDLPEGPFDLVALPFPRSSEALLMRDLLEAAHDRLRIGGRLVAATDGAPPALRETLKKVFGNWTPAAPIEGKGACFFAERKREAPRSSDHSHVLTPEIRHGTSDTVTRLEIETRPGTFSHGRLDRGTRALAEWLRPNDDDHAVLDLGAGCGVLGLYLAKRLPKARVVLVESNVRAAECARRNAERNGVADRVELCVRADLEQLPVASDGGYALAVMNPPYFGNFRIAESFVAAAHAALRPGGRLALVAKASDAHLERVRTVFGTGTVRESGGYGIVIARKSGHRFGVGVTP